MSRTLLNEVNAVLKKSGLIQGSTGELTSLTNDALQVDIDNVIKACNIAVLDLERCGIVMAMRAAGSITLVLGQREYTMPSNYVEMVGDVMVDETFGGTLTPYVGGFMQMRNEQLIPANFVGMPYAWCINPTTGSFRINTTPDATAAGRVYGYIYRPTLLMSLATDLFPLKDDAVEALEDAIEQQFNRHRKGQFDQSAHQMSMARAAQIARQLPLQPRYGVVRATGYLGGGGGGDGNGVITPPVIPPDPTPTPDPPLTPPVNLTAPIIEGVPPYLPGSTVSVTSNGTWSNSPLSFTYQWRSNGVAISGETTSSYVIGTGLTGNAIDCQVTGVNDDGSSAAVSSNIVVGSEAVVATLDALNATSLAALKGAWSVSRRMRSDYVGPMVRIRRSSDSLESDFGALLANLDDTLVQAFLAGSNGFISKIYDQFGVNDLIQATPASQPAYLATAIGGLPGADFNGTAHVMTANGMAAFYTGSDMPMTLQWIGKNDTYTGTDTLFAFAKSSSSTPFFAMQDNTNAAIQVTRRPDSGSIITAATGVIMIPGDKIYTVRFTGTAVTTYMNGNPLQGHIATAMDTGALTLDRFAIGARVSSTTTNFMDGKFTECVLFSIDIGAAETEIIDGNARDYYGAPVMGLFGQTSQQQLPDALTGSDSGKGFTCTGMTRDKQDGTSWWVCNFGAATPADITYEPSLVKISNDGSTKLDEIPLLALYPGMSAGSFQDVTEDTTTHSLWIASSGEGRVRRLTKAGVDTGDVFVLLGVSGIAYDSVRDTLWCTTSTKLREYTKAGALLREVETGFSDADQVFYDEVNDLVFVSESDEPSPFVIYSYNPTTEVFGEVIYRLASSQAGEGFDVTGSTISVVNDGYYHDNIPPLNLFQTYTRVL